MIHRFGYVRWGGAHPSGVGIAWSVPDRRCEVFLGRLNIRVYLPHRRRLRPGSERREWTSGELNVILYDREEESGG